LRARGGSLPFGHPTGGPYFRDFRTTADRRERAGVWLAVWGSAGRPIQIDLVLVVPELIQIRRHSGCLTAKRSATLPSQVPTTPPAIGARHVGAADGAGPKPLQRTKSTWAGSHSGQDDIQATVPRAMRSQLTATRSDIEELRATLLALARLGNCL
jgi:hypothetical protein